MSDFDKEFENDRNPVLRSLRAAKRDAEKLYGMSRKISSNNDAPSPDGQRLRIYSDIGLTSSGDTVTAFASESAKVAVLGENGWIPIDFTDDVTYDTTGSTTDKKYDFFAVYDEINGAWTLESIGWTNETTRATSLDTIDGVRLSSADNTWRYIGTGRYNGSAMIVTSTDNLGTSWWGTGDPYDPTGADPFTGVIINADGISGYNAGVLQFQDLTLDGTRTAGAGAVVLDALGIHTLEGIAIEMGTYASITMYTDVGGNHLLIMVQGNNTNVLTNGDFETGDLTGWSTTTTGTSSVAVDSAVTHAGGLYSAKLIKQSGFTCELYQTVGGEVVDFWALGNGTDQLQVSGSGGGSYSIRPPTTWTRYRLPLGTSTNVKFSPGDGDTIWIDDVIFADTVYGRIDILQNGTVSTSGTLAVTGAITATGAIIGSNYNPGANVAAFLATPSSANLAAAVTGETGSGALVFATSPALTTPNIGAATGTSLTTTSDITVAETNNLKGGNQTIVDDGVYSFTPANSSGIIVLMGNESGGATVGGMFFYRTNATVACVAISAGSNTNATTGALTGTTGTDTKFTISTHTDGKIYLENRRGASRITHWVLLT